MQICIFIEMRILEDFDKHKIVALLSYLNLYILSISKPFLSIRAYTETMFSYCLNAIKYILCNSVYSRRYADTFKL